MDKLNVKIAQLEEEVQFLRTQLEQYQTQERIEKGQLYALDNLPDGALFRAVRDMKVNTLKIEYVSATWETILGISAEDTFADIKILLNKINEDDLQYLREIFNESISSLTPINIEFRYNHPFTENEKWFQLTTFNRQEGEIIYLDGFIFDISSRKKVEIKSNVQESLLQALDKMRDGMVFRTITNTKTGTYKLDYVSGTCENLLGISINNALSDISKLFANIHPDDLKLLKDSITESKTRNNKFNIEIRYNHPVAKKQVWYEVSSYPRLENDLIIADGFIFDITDKKDFDHKLLFEKDRYESIGKNLINSVLFRLEQNSLTNYTYLSYVSGKWEEITGIPSEKAINSIDFLYKIINTDDLLVLISAFDKSSSTMSDLLVEFRITVSGATRWLNMSSVPYRKNEITIWDGIITDITHRKETEQELENEKKRMKMLSDNLPNCSLYQFVRDNRTGQMRMSYVSGTWEAVSGVSEEETLANISKVFDKIDQDDLPALIQSIEESARTMTDHYFETRLNNQWVNIIARPRPEGVFTVWDGLLTNISEKKKTEKDLEIEKNRLKILSDNLPDSALFQLVKDNLTRQLRLSYVSSTWESVTGVSVQNALSDITKMWELIPDEDFPAFIQAVEQSAKTMSQLDVEIHQIDKRWIRCVGNPRIEDYLTIWDGMLVDITKNKNTETELIISHQELEQLVKERTEELAVSNEELKLANEEVYAINEELFAKNKLLTKEIEAHNAMMLRLEESENKMRNFIEQSLEGIIILDENGRVIEWNPEQEMITGLFREYVLGEYGWEVFRKVASSENQEEHVQQLREIIFKFLKPIENEQKYHKEIEIEIYPDGQEKKHLILNSFQIKFAEKFYMGQLVRDITQQKLNEIELEQYRGQLERMVEAKTHELSMEHERLKAIGDNFPGGSFFRLEINSQTEEMHFTYLSDTWTEVTGLDNHKTLEDISYALNAILPEDLEKMMGKINESVKTMGHFNAEIKFNHPSGEIRWLQISSHPHFLDEKIIVSDGFILDITEMKNIVKELEDYKLNLEDLVQVRTEELETAYEEMEATNEELEQYKNHLEQMVEQKTSELVESQQRLVSLSNNLPGGVIFQISVDISKTGNLSYKESVKFMFISDTLIDIIGINSQQIFENSELFFNMIHPEDKEKVISLMKNNKNLDVVDLECRIITNKNELKWMQIRVILRVIDKNTWIFEGFMIDISLRKKNEMELNEIRKRQNVLINVLQIVQSSQKFGNVIDIALSEIGKYADVSRAYIFEKTPDGNFVNNLYEWCNTGITPEKDNLQNVPIEKLERWFDTFERDEIIYASNIYDLPNPQEVEVLESQGIKSVLVFPLIINEKVYGFVGFDDCEKYREWAENDITLLKNLSQIISETTRRFNAENTILLSQQTLRTVLDNMDAYVYVANFDSGEILFANKHIKLLFGENIEGKISWEVFGEQERKPDLILYKDNEPIKGEAIRWENINELTNRWYESIDSTIEWVNGQIVRLQYAIDITDRKKAEESLLKSEEMYRLLTVASPDAIIVIGIDSRLKFISEKTKELFKLDNNIEIDKINILNYIHFQNKRHVVEFFNSFVSNSFTQLPQLLLKRGDNTEFYGEISSAPIKENGKIVSYVIVIRDITERKQIELDLIRAKDRAEEADYLKSAFLANMSHEIRTPMNGILGFASLIQIEVDEEISPRTSQYAQIINDNCQSLLQLLDDIIDISKLESNQMKIIITECNINILLSDLLLLYNQLLRDKQKEDLVEIILDQSDEEEVVMADSIRLQQVMTNLISNAIKFTDSGTINFGYERQNEDYLKFYVRDTGIGIHKKYCNIIFERFRQVDEDRQMNIGGTGLGLAISKNLIEMMDGKIWVESELGVGSTFYFTIKAKRKNDDAEY